VRNQDWVLFVRFENSCLINCSRSVWRSDDGSKSKKKRMQVFLLLCI